ncbi:hypothetical protein EQO05_07360 [Methanosarcina sp. MSH10X1]|nr:hypothetical protein EQO05_07360 [Methanosarcina sp. MSH10X1]
MLGVFNAQAYGVWTILYPDYNRLIGGIGGLIGGLIGVIVPARCSILSEKELVQKGLVQKGLYR